MLLRSRGKVPCFLLPPERSHSHASVLGNFSHLLDETRVKLWGARPAEAGEPGPGVAAEVGGAILLGTADGPVELAEVQPAGRGRMPAAAWMRGRRGRPAVFTPPGV